jgi:hypothetical protein
MQTAIPVLNPDNPGKSTVYDLKRHKNLKRSSKASSQTIDLVALLNSVLLTYGQKATRKGNWLRLDNGFWMLPQWNSGTVINGLIFTETTVEVHHPIFIPNGVFEYQYVDSAKSIAASFLTGLNEWYKTRAVTLFDSLLAEPKSSTQMVMKFPNDANVVMTDSGSSSGKTRLRRVIFGPVVYFVSLSADAQKDTNSSKSNGAKHDDYCPCCLLNRLKYILMPVLNSDDYTVIQLSSFRESAEDINASCYVNGKKFDAGTNALIEDIKTWPIRGSESRDYFIIVQNDPAT